jgi:predicted nucleotidyltransferase
MKKLELAKEFARTLQDAAAEKIILYGSVARGEEKEDSDVDVLVLSSDKEKIRAKVIERAIDILLDTGTYISVKVITPGEFERLKHTHFISQIVKEGVVIG